MLPGSLIVHLNSAISAEQTEGEYNAFILDFLVVGGY